MFAGLRSRWMTPFSCAASSPSAICTKSAIASATGIGPALDAIGERLALDQLHDEELVAPSDLEAVDRARCADG